MEIDFLEKLIQPVEYPPSEFNKQVKDGRLLCSDSVDSITDRNPPIDADSGTIQARPPLEEVSPYGVRWRGSVDRRKDWMTSLTDFSERITRRGNQTNRENQRSGRAPLAPLIDQLTKASQPLAYQVVFQRKPDWSSDARRQSGALLVGQDTLLQKLPGDRITGIS